MMRSLGDRGPNPVTRRRVIEEGNDGSRDNCAECKRRLVKERAATAHLAM